MPRRVSLPGAAELFRSTGTPLEEAPTTEEPSGNGTPAAHTADAGSAAPSPAGVRTTTRRRSTSDGGPSGRERHEEKITVYCSADELFELEHARLTLRGEHGLAVDRGRIVREAVAVVLADLAAKGESSILVRRLRGH
ncbi:MAG: hypothetical protein QOG53_2783 [Frankiales bacterium]|jgi:hypothetical protein|nr:hypothetical protein [Frankiales bacterium]